MHKKILVLIGILVLTINAAIGAVSFSSATKTDYQKRLNNLLNTASSYTYISSAEMASYQKHINETLNALESSLNNSNMPESEKIKIINSFNCSIASMEKSINNPNIPASKKIAGIKTVLQGMQTSIAQNTAYQQEELARKKEQAEQKAKREAEVAALQKKEAEEKAKAEKIRLEDEKDVKMLQQGTKVIREYAHFYEFKMKYVNNNSVSKVNMVKVYDDFCKSKGEKLPSRKEIASLISVFNNVNINPDEAFTYYLNYIHPDRKYVVPLMDINRLKHFADLRENGAVTEMYIRSRDVVNGKNLAVRLISMAYQPASLPIEVEPFAEEHLSRYIMCINNDYNQ